MTGIEEPVNNSVLYMKRIGLSRCNQHWPTGDVSMRTECFHV